MNEVDLAISIVNWNTKGLLRQCLRSVYENTDDLRYEIVVVDNNSSDGSAEMLKKEFPSVKLIENRENFGFACANNQALKLSRGRYFLLLNSDTIVRPNTLETMVDFMDTHPEVGAVGPRLLNEDGTFQRSCWKQFPSVKSILINYFYLYKLLPRSRFVRSYEVPPIDSDKPFEVAHLLGASLMIRREAIKDVGVLDEQFYMYLEETDWCYRMHQKGWRVYCLPFAEVIHYGQKSAKKNLLEMIKQETRSHCKFFRKNYKASHFRISLLKVVIISGMAVRVMVYVLQTLYGKEKNRKSDVLAYGKAMFEVYRY